MTQIIISQNGQGGVALTSAGSETTLEEVLEKGGIGDLARIVEVSDLPAHPEFTDAWEMDATSVTVNLAKAKELTKTRLRNERTPLLAAQDVAFQRALESGADTTAIVAEKQRLRDLPSLADA